MDPFLVLIDTGSPLSLVKAAVVVLRNYHDDRHMQSYTDVELKGAGGEKLRVVGNYGEAELQILRDQV